MNKHVQKYGSVFQLSRRNVYHACAKNHGHPFEPVGTGTKVTGFQQNNFSQFWS